MRTVITSVAPRPGSAALSSEWVTLINCRSFHYVTAGPEDAPALLFLHGFSDSWRSAELLIPHLTTHFRIFILDQRGHGESDADFDRFSIADFSHDAADFIESVIGGPVTLVGHSLGSLIAQRIAAHYQDLVTRLVLIGSADTSGGNPGLIDLKHALAELGGRIPAEFVRALQESTLAQPIAREQLEVFTRESLRLQPAVWHKVAAALSDDDQVIAGRIRVPTLILWGDQDSVFDLHAQHRLQRLLKQSKLTVYPEVGHAPNWEIPETVARDIIGFSLQ
jgi:pimeloyl-ACP methyl ester carboxylesterase